MSDTAQELAELRLRNEALTRANARLLVQLHDAVSSLVSAKQALQELQAVVRAAAAARRDGRPAPVLTVVAIPGVH